MNAIIQPVLFDYNALDTESRVKLQQLERELKDDHHTVDRLVAETLDKMWSIGSKYHEAQLLLRSRATNNFKTWFTATHAADNGGLLRKAYRCINIYQNVSRDKLSLLADTGKSTVYTLAAKETPDAARAEIFKRLGAGEKLEANDIVEIIESAKAAEMPMMLPMVVDEPATTGIETFRHLTPDGAADDHIVEVNEMVTPAVTETHEVGASYHEAMKPVGTPKFTPGQLNTTHVIGDKPTPGPAAQWLEKQKAAPPPPAPKAESPTVSDQEQYEAANKVLVDLIYEVGVLADNIDLDNLDNVEKEFDKWQAIIASLKTTNMPKCVAVKAWLASVSTKMISFKAVDLPESVEDAVYLATQGAHLSAFLDKLIEELEQIANQKLPALFPKQAAAPIAPPSPPPPPPAAKPVSELAKVEYSAEGEGDDDDDDDDDGEMIAEPVELTPITPPPPPASAIPLPPPPPLVGRAQIDIAVEFSKLSEEKQFEVAWLILNKLTKKQVSDLFIKYQTEGRK